MTIAALGQSASDFNALGVEATSAKTRVTNAIKTAADKSGVDFAYLMQKAETESSFNPKAQAKGSSARGLYQFTDSTWLDTLDKHAAKYGRADLASSIDRKNGVAYVADPAKRKEILAMRDDPELSSCMAAELANDNAACLKEKTGVDANGTELYLAHFLGAGGASQLINKLQTSPSTPAASILPQAAAANHSIFYTEGGRAKSVQEIYDHFAAKFDNTGSTTVASAAGAANSNSATDADSMNIAQMAMPSVGANGKTRNPFDAFTVGYDQDDDDSRKGSGDAVMSQLYQQVSSSQLSATGNVYRGVSGAQAQSQSMYYALWLADHANMAGVVPNNTKNGI